MKKVEKHVPYKYKVLELFGGIGAPRKALDNLFGDCKIKSVDYVDILNWAVEAYNKISTECYLPQSVTKWNLDVDILIHGSPCQDFSLAGKQKGGDKNSGTRSSLLWETINIINNRLNKLPKVIIWENVKGVLNRNHRHIFDAYLKELESLGYKNKWSVLNGIHFGVPQKRERVFVVSVLESATEFKHFDFDNLEKVEMKSLKSYLENDVDISYYLNQPSMVKAIKNGKVKIIDKETQTITTKQMRWNNAGVIKIPLVEVQHSSTWTNSNKVNSIFTRVKKESDLSLSTNSFDSFGKITIPFTDHFASNQVWSIKKTIPTIQTMPHNLKVVDFLEKITVSWNEKTHTHIPLKFLESKSKIIKTKNYSNFFIYPRKLDNKLINGSYNRVWKSKGYVATIPATNILKINEPIEIEGNFYKVKLDKKGNTLPIFFVEGKPCHVRYLTERECWRLMGFSDNDFDKIIHLPKVAKYFLAGNSIIVDVLEAIFKELLWN